MRRAGAKPASPSIFSTSCTQATASQKREKVGNILQTVLNKASRRTARARRVCYPFTDLSRMWRLLLHGFFLEIIDRYCRY